MAAVRLLNSSEWRAFAKFLGTFATAIMIAWVAVTYGFNGSRPEIADPGIGRIYTLNTHGHIVYLSLRELITVDGLFYGALLCGSVAVAIGLRVEGKV